MTNTQIVQLLLMGGIVGIAVSAILFFVYSKVKVDFPKVLDTIDTGLEVSEPVIKLAKNAFPGNKFVNIIDMIEHYAELGVGSAEQLYHASKITSDVDRNTAAKETVYAAFKEFDLTPTENQEKLINSIIEYMVGDLGHTDKTDEQKEAEKQALVKENQDLKTNVQQLQEKINQIQCVAQK